MKIVLLARDSPIKPRQHAYQTLSKGFHAYGSYGDHRVYPKTSLRQDNKKRTKVTVVIIAGDTPAQAVQHLSKIIKIFPVFKLTYSPSKYYQEKSQRE